MIITRAPLRISFVGGGTDIKEFYEKYPGKVISSTIDKFVYTAINHGRFLDQFLVKYSETELVKHPKNLKHDRFREALIKMDIVSNGLEIASFADLPAKTGLGSSSSFSVSLIKALAIHKGISLSKEEAAELACELEIDILKEPIGKQDQYASSFGGFNVFQFNSDGSVDVEPVYLDFKVRMGLEDHSLLFFTGITRAASSVLTEQKTNMSDKFEIYKSMSDSVPKFQKKLENGDFKGMAEMMNEGWERKKSLASSVSTGPIDSLYESALKGGAWGGKVLGAGGGGCLFFIAPPEKHGEILETLRERASELNLDGFKKIDFDFSQSGTDILFNSTHNYA